MIAPARLSAPPRGRALPPGTTRPTRPPMPSALAEHALWPPWFRPARYHMCISGRVICGFRWRRSSAGWMRRL